jgi:hypothetical protein
MDLTRPADAFWPDVDISPMQSGACDSLFVRSAPKHQQEETMTIERSQIIARPPSVVFRFYAIEHVQNHPRWDPDMQLEQLTEEPCFRSMIG